MSTDIRGSLCVCVLRWRGGFGMVSRSVEPGVSAQLA